MRLNVIEQPGLYIQKTNVNAQKIDNSKLKRFGIVIAYLLDNKNGKSRFFELNFLIS